MSSQWLGEAEQFFSLMSCQEQGMCCVQMWLKAPKQERSRSFVHVKRMNE